jgi:hypothetical protein
MFLASLGRSFLLLFTVILYPICTPAQSSIICSTEEIMTRVLAVIAVLVTTSALAESPYPTPTADGRQRIQRTGTCPAGYVGSGNFCEALHKDTPAAMPKIKGAACPSGHFASGDSCKAFR